MNGSTVSFLYDGSNTVQEQSGGAPVGNLLTGGVDQLLNRTDAAATVGVLTDALGSTIALADSTGAIQTQYGYEPFGKASASGVSSNNPNKYTGRKDDGAGLYYYRARYYSPSLQRFISEDPIGLLGGINVYTYVDNNPTNFTDPSGLKPWDPFGDGGYAAGARGGWPPRTPPWENGRWWQPHNGRYAPDEPRGP